MEIIKSNIKKRIYFLSFFLVLVWIVIVGKLFSIQVTNNEHYRNISRKQSEYKKTLESGRGTIFDRNHKPLAINTIHYSFAAHPLQIKYKTRLAKEFAKTFNTNYQQYLKKLKSGQKFVWLERNVPKSIGNELFKKYKNNKNIIIYEKNHREYPFNELAGQLLGFTNVDNNGLSGLEKEFNSELSGTPGFQILEKDGKGKKTFRPDFNKKPAIDGSDIILTLDHEYQAILQQELYAAFEKFDADNAMGIIVDPATGEIRAVASIPLFDPNHTLDYNVSSRKNILVTDIFEPGSTFKIVAATAALEEKSVTPEDTIETEKGYIIVQTRKIHDHEVYPNLSFADVIKHSSNVGTIKVAQKLGKSELFTYILKFGFGAKTNIDFPGEVPGQLVSLKKWTDLRLAQVAMGHGITCTSLQLAMAYSAIANGGELLKPQIVKSIIKPTGKISINKKKVIRRVASENTMEIIRKLLLHTVKSGTGTKANVRGMNIAGKTGTAQKVVDGKYSKSEYIASFAGFFPAENPQLVCVVVVDNPKGPNHYGGTVSAPVVKNVFTRITNLSNTIMLTNKKNKKNKQNNNIVSTTLENEIVKKPLPRKGNQFISKVDNNSGMIKVPDFRKMSMQKALTVGQSCGLHMIIRGSGKVQKQSVSRGKIVKNGTVCIVDLSS